MKTKLLISIAAMGLVPVMQGCDDHGEVIYIDPVYAYEDAQEAIAVSLAYSSYGLVANMNQASNEIQDISTCDQLHQNKDTIYNETAPGYISYEYVYNEEYMLSCDNPSVDYDLTAEETLKTVRASYDHSLSVNFTVTGLEDESSDEIYNGAYKRIGAWDAIYYDDDYQFTFDSQIADAHVSKQSHKIYSGTVTFTLVQSYGATNVDYTYQGTVEFLNEDEAKVVFDDGSEYMVDLNNISINDN